MPFGNNLYRTLRRFKFERRFPHTDRAFDRCSFETLRLLTDQVATQETFERFHVNSKRRFEGVNFV